MSYYQVPSFCGIYFVPVPVGDLRVVGNVVPSWLPQVSLSTESKIFDTSSRTVLIQTFVNPSKSDAIEQAKYNFPLYESCAVVAFRCYVEGRLIEGIVKEKNEAKAEYKAAVAQGKTAGLLEQFTPDVFRTSLGNIPAGATVKVEVEYIMELKHDAEVDGLRFTIPTSIAPRYGDAPYGLSTTSDGQPIQEALETGGMKISIQITMPSNVQSVQSPSHPISVHLGGHVENVSDDSFNSKLAIATLSQTSTELGKDFILLVKCADLSSPRALLETHDAKPNSKALMVTVVPKFTLPPGSKPEIVFVVDRSGSMEDRIPALKSALAVFLKSLPVGVRFNICSFGSDHSFLWKKSRPYSAETLEEAQKHTETMDAEMGGTEILPPIRATVDRRYKDLPLEIMVLTDGEVWDTESLFQYIEQTTSAGDVRLFSLGIGEDVSHSLVEGMARVGRGFAQIVSNEQEGIEGKVVRMLRGGLSAHIKDYRLEWEGRPSEEQVKLIAAKDKPTSGTSTSTLQRAVQGVRKKINLFDKKAKTDSPITTAQPADDTPAFVVPAVLQAPYKLPPLFPFSRTTVYVLLTEDVTAPSSVWLRGTTPSGDELELEIPVQVLPEHAHTIHQLTARKILQELEEGNSYLHGGNYEIVKEENPGTFEDWVSGEGTRVAVEYGLASKWTSFIAVDKQGDAQPKGEETVQVDAEPESREQMAEADDSDLMLSYSLSVPPPPPPAVSAPLKKKAFGRAAPAPPAPGGITLGQTMSRAAPTPKGSWPIRTFHTIARRRSRSPPSLASGAVGVGAPPTVSRIPLNPVIEAQTDSFGAVCCSAICYGFFAQRKRKLGRW